MIQKVLVDSDVILDVATGRLPFVEKSRACLSYLESGHALGILSGHSVTNMYCILRKLGSDSMARMFLSSLLKYLSIGAIDHKGIVSALESRFLDFEDGVQNCCAINNQCDAILTRNIADYQFAGIRVMNPQDFLALFKGGRQ
ncbi:MAG: PIN domain-containing protein [Spirochaetota bacterium]